MARVVAFFFSVVVVAVVAQDCSDLCDVGGLPADCGEFRTTIQDAYDCGIENDCPLELGVALGRCIAEVSSRSCTGYGVSECFSDALTTIDAAGNPEAFNFTGCSAAEDAVCTAIIDAANANPPDTCKDFEAEYRDYVACQQECAEGEVGTGIYVGSCQATFNFIQQVSSDAADCSTDKACAPNGSSIAAPTAFIGFFVALITRI